MKTYPIFVLLEDKPCLVVGGGSVGERKVLDLLEAGARVTVVSKDLTPTLTKLAQAGEIRYLNEPFTPEQVNGMVLVLAATDDREVNARVSAAAQARGILVNVADAPEYCNFIVPARVRRGELTLAISTGGASPAVAQKLRQELEQRFGPEYKPYLALLQGVRDRLLGERRGHPENAALFHRLAAGPLLEAVAGGDRARVVAVLREILGHALSPQVLGELTSEAFQENWG
jgi:precorrin-2 dehydrogenase/sirohydrochlorin ferrochelatase